MIIGTILAVEIKVCSDAFLSDWLSGLARLLGIHLVASMIYWPSHSIHLFRRGLVYPECLPAFGIKLLLREPGVVRIRFIVG
jgi:hypothetical protein